MSILDTAEYRRLALLAAGVDPSQIPAILDTATWRRLMIVALYDLSQGGGGSPGFISGSVQFYADLPVTVGTPLVNTAYLVRENSGVWFINRKPAGIYVKLTDTGSLTDWDYAGEFPAVNDSQYFRIYDTADPTKEMAFGVSDISSGTTRTFDAPNRDGRIAVSDYRLLSANANAVTGDKVAADTTSGAWTLTLPATPSNGDTVTVLDYASTFDTNNLTIARNGSNIESLAEDLVCEVEDAAFTLVYVGSTVGWKVVPFQGTAIPSVRSDATGIAGASAIDNIVTISQANYDALGSYDAGTVYIITDP